MNSKYRMNVIVFIVFITIFPIISSSPATELNENEHLDSSKKYNNKSKLKDSNTDSSSSSNPEKEQLFAHYRESYITKEAAKKFRQRVRSHKTPYSDNDYDDLIQEIDFKPKHKKASSDIYDKKYFDYLPAELNTEEQIEKSEEFTKENHKKGKHIKKSHRTRRDVSSVDQAAESSDNVNQNKDVAKRQINYYPSQYLLDSERGFVPSSYPVYKQNIGLGQGYYYPVPSNNPWSNKYYSLSRPYLNNHYLPAAVSPNYVYIRPQIQPFELYPTPNVYYNPAFPPVNPPSKGQVVTQKPTETPIKVDNRFDDDDKFIWDIVDNRNPNSINVVGPPTRRPPTRKPAPSIIRGGDDTTNAPVTQRVRTRRPPASIIRGMDDVTAAPATTTVKYVTPSRNQPELGPAYQRPAPTQSPSTANRGPTRCVWGIVNCCSRGSTQLRSSCFEQIGCGGAFWDLNPCSDLIFDAALQETNNYFD